MTTRPLPVRPLIGGCLLGLAALSLTGCSVSVTASDQHWDTAHALRSSSSSDVVPSLVNSDATSIDLHEPQSAGTTALRWKSDSGITRSDCQAGPITDADVHVDWWPSTEPKTGWTCGFWTVFTDDGDFYASKGPQGTGS